MIDALIRGNNADAGNDIRTLVGRIGVAEGVDSDERQIRDSAADESQRVHLPAGSHGAAESGGVSKQTVSGTEREVVKKTEIQVVADVVRACTAIAGDAIHVLRQGRVQSVILHIVNRLGVGVIN